MPMVFPRYDLQHNSTILNYLQVKELYEPLWEELHARSKVNGFRIRSIWITDVAQQGASGVLNEQLLGNDRKSSPF
jgi:hypothetical protein